MAESRRRNPGPPNRFRVERKPTAMPAGRASSMRPMMAKPMMAAMTRTPRGGEYAVVDNATGRVASRHDTRAAAAASARTRGRAVRRERARS